MLPFSAVACYPLRVLVASLTPIPNPIPKPIPHTPSLFRFSSGTVAVFVVFVYVYFSYIFHWHSAFIGFYKYLMDFKWRLRCCRWHFIIFCFEKQKGLPSLFPWPPHTPFFSQFVSGVHHCGVIWLYRYMTHVNDCKLKIFSRQLLFGSKR